MVHTTGSTTEAAEPLIRFRAVRKEFASGAVAVEGLDLDVRPHELLALVGPSGCGKSTTLRMVNRLVEPSSGQVLLDGEDVMGVDAVALRRRIGYVIQHVGLFPHRTVTQNVTTVPRLLGWEKRRAAARVEELLDLVGLDPATYGRRYPHELSGGERQRVGVARALAVDPPVLLMDEPFGAVDPEGRRRLQIEFRRIQQTLGTTVMLVTHDIDEAVRLADRVVVLSRGGVVEQVADPVTLLARPANAFVEQFIGAGRETRLLGFGRVEQRDLEAAGSVDALVKDGPGAGPVALGASLDDALAALSGAGPGGVPVVDDGGAVVGRLTADGLLAALRRVTSAA